ncbi:MAG: type 4a pilus biogenesis protein PilO [Desulfobacterales bacterium]|nr:type 4a pilus biogenesis protein PilO [Desulfobacterales bacterium]
MTLSIKKIDVVCLVSLVAVVSLAGYFAASRIIKQKRQVQQENALLSRKLNEMNMAKSSLQEIRKVFDATTAELKSFNDRIPEAGKFGDFLKQLDLLLQQRTIALLSLNPFPAEKKDSYRKIPIHLTLEGSFINIYRFLYDLEKLNRLVVMEKMSMSRTDRDNLCRVTLYAGVFERN